MTLRDVVTKCDDSLYIVLQQGFEDVFYEYHAVNVWEGTPRDMLEDVNGDILECGVEKVNVEYGGNLIITI